jgi:quercetin dioxygenase-like cupin family protein
MEKLSLDALARELMKSATAAPAGRASRTVYGGHEHVLRQTLMVLTAGASMSEHENPGEATVHVLDGRVRLAADAVEWEGRDGDLLIVPQARHTLHALEDAAVLLTVANCHRRPEYPVGEGPCLAAFAQDRVVAVQDLGRELVWDRIAAVVGQLQVRGVLSAECAGAAG